MFRHTMPHYYRSVQQVFKYPHLRTRTGGHYVTFSTLANVPAHPAQCFHVAKDGLGTLLFSTESAQPLFNKKKTTTFFIYSRANTTFPPPHTDCLTVGRMGSMGYMYRALIFVALLCAVEARVFRAAYIFNGVISDFGWGYTHNEGRIRAQDALAKHVEAQGDVLETEIFEQVPGNTSVSMMGTLSSTFDIIFTTSFEYHEQTFQAAKENPNTDFVHISGYYSGEPNFVTAHGRVYHSRYVSGVAAGGKSKTKRIGYIGSIKIPEVYRSANAYYLGAQVGAGAIMNSTYIEHKVDVVVIWIDTFYDPVKEREAARRLHAMGCDVISYHTDTQEGALYAKESGIYSVAANADGRKFIGESVLTSTNFNWEPIYTELMNRSYSGTFRSGSHSLWYGYPSGVSVNYDPSFKVGNATKQLFHETATKMKGGFDPFCHPVWKDGVRVQENVGDCLGDFYLAVKMDYLIDGVSNTGDMLAVGEVCGNGTTHVADVLQSPPKYTFICSNCTAGTFSHVEDVAVGVQTCGVCPPGTYSAEGASECIACGTGTFSDRESSSCTLCPEGRTNTGVGNGGCPFEENGDDSTVLIIVLCSVAALLLFGAPLVGYRVMRDRSKISSLHSEKAVAMRCAESIARMQLEELDDIRGIEDPSDIIQSFVQIIDNLIEYRRYLPRTLLVKYDEDIDEVTALPPDRFAPGLDTQVATIVFTDIQSSTELWESLEDSMHAALYLHNALIREQITKYNGYEVKTIGDAFMVAFDTEAEGIKFALGMQEALQTSEKWPESLHTHPQSKLVGTHWKGVRVRVGVNTGPVNTEENDLTGRVDYFGSTVNKAARLEAAGAGGSVCVTRESFDVMKDNLDSFGGLFSMDLHKVRLKGFKDLQELTLLLPAKLSARREDILLYLRERGTRQHYRKQGGEQSERMSASGRSSRLSSQKAHGHGRTEVAKYFPVGFETMQSATVCNLRMNFVLGGSRLQDALPAAFSTVLLHLERTKGHVIAAQNCSLMVGWNTVPAQTVASHMLLSSRFVALCETYFSHQPYSAAMGLCSGSVDTGNVGTGNQKFITVVGTPINVAEALVQEALHFHCFACIASYGQKLSVLTDSFLKGATRPVSRLHVSGAGADLVGTTLTVYEMAFDRDGEGEADDDWMWSKHYREAFTSANFNLIRSKLANGHALTPTAVCNYLEEHGSSPRMTVEPTSQDS